jgi:hypothetical protein
MSKEIMQQALDALKAWDSLIKYQYSGTSEAMTAMQYAAWHTVDVIAAIEQKLAKPEQAYEEVQITPTAIWRWVREGNVYVSRLTQEHMDQFKQDLENSQKELAKPEPVVSFTDNEEGLWIQLECNGSYYSQNLSESKTAKFFVDAYRKKK